MTRSRVRMIISNYTNMEVYSKQEEIEVAIEQELAPVFQQKNLFLEDVLLGNISPSSDNELRDGSREDKHP